MSLLRLDEILVNDKFENISKIGNLLESEVSEVAKNYLVLSGGAVVRYRKEGEKFIFNVELTAERVKPFGKIIGWFDFFAYFYCIFILTMLQFH